MRYTHSLLVAGLAVVCLGRPTPAQVPYFMGNGTAPVFQVNPALQQGAVNQALINQAVLNQALTQQAVASRVGAIPGLPNYLGSATISSTPAFTPSTSPASQYWGGNGNSPQSFSSGYGAGGYFIESPVGGFYRGVADLTLAYGQYMQDYQQARLMNEDVERSRIVTRRQLIEEWRWRQSLIPKAEDIRRVEIERDLARATKQAPIGEILAGKSLNVLLTQLKTFHGAGKRGPSIPTSDDVLKQLNASTRQGRNVGLFKSNKISWPASLRMEPFAPFRKQIDSSLELAIERAKINGKVDDALLGELNTARKALDARVDVVATDDKANVGLSMGQYIEAKRFLGLLSEGIRALEDPDVINFFNRKYEVLGKTVADVVDYMNREGLVFVDSVPGSEGAYRTMYAWLLSYYEAIAQLASR